MLKTETQRRPAFTLVELLVVVAIIVAIASLSVLILNATSDRRAANRGADQLQGWISTAKYRALRDGAPRGVRLILNPLNSNQATGLIYLEQPDNYLPPTGTTLNYYPPGATATPPNPNMSLPFVTVQGDITPFVFNGDMLELTTAGEPAHRISTAPTYSGTVTTFNLAAPVQTALGLPLVITSGYVFIPQPRPLMGEAALELPTNVIIDLTQSQLNLSTNLDIVFTPQGQVLGATTGACYLVVTSTTGVGEPTLIAIYTRTGGIAAHPLAPAPNIYAYAQDGFNSGL